MIKVDLSKFPTKLVLDKIDLSKFDKRKLFKSRLIIFLGLSVLTIVICIFLLSLIRANKD